MTKKTEDGGNISSKTALQHENDNLREYLDKVQDLYAWLNDIGATVTESEFLDIILASLPPSYEVVMFAWDFQDGS